MESDRDDTHGAATVQETVSITVTAELTGRDPSFRRNDVVVLANGKRLDNTCKCVGSRQKTTNDQRA